MTRDFRGAATCQWEYSSLELFAFSWSWTPAPNGFLSCQRQVLFHFCSDRRRHLHLCKENFIVQKKERIPTETENTFQAPCEDQRRSKSTDSHGLSSDVKSISSTALILNTVYTVPCRCVCVCYFSVSKPT